MADACNVVKLMNVIIEKSCLWRAGQEGEIRYWHIGSERLASSFLDFWNQNETATLRDFSEFFRKGEGNFGLIAERRGRIVGAVDRVRSYPIYYIHSDAYFSISNSARALTEEKGVSGIDEVSLLEFCMAGYVTGRETLFKHLYQLQAGECLLWEKEGNAVDRERYFLFLPNRCRRENEEALIEELDWINNRIFGRIIEGAGSREIWVPLSGGLDSRLVVCKLHELGCSHLKTFSYGPPGNYEAKAARQVAETLGVPWCFIPTKRRSARTFFHSEQRKDYWSFSDGLCAVPFMQDLDTLSLLLKGDRITKDAIVINGQSGDFITGGHLPLALIGGNGILPKMMSVMVEKHYSLWSTLKVEENLKKVEWKTAQNLKSTGIDLDSADTTALYELWEWQERQSKYVVNGQRTYDFLRLFWELPLWDKEYLDFWKDIPASLRSNQMLYRRYLQKYNYRKLFREFAPNIWRWPGSTILFVPAARLAGYLLGQRFKSQFYRYAGYLGHYRSHYAPYHFTYFLRNISKARGPVSFYVDTWMEENGLSIPFRAQLCRSCDSHELAISRKR